jgi:hypothetical protein
MEMCSVNLFECVEKIAFCKIFCNLINLMCIIKIRLVTLNDISSQANSTQENLIRSEILSFYFFPFKANFYEGKNGKSSKFQV